jgi:hypothetical protein
MPGPVQHASRANRDFVEAARSAGVGGSETAKPGPSANAVKKSQGPTLKQGLEENALPSGLTVVGEVVAGGHGLLSGAAATALGPVLTGYGYFAAFHKAHSQGEELSNAYARDSINLAVVFMASGVLPNDYVQRMAHEYKDVGGLKSGYGQGGAARILHALTGDDKRYQAVKAEAERFAKAGMRFARTHGITSDQKLKEALTKDRRFAGVFEKNIAFRHGIQAEIMQAQQRELHRARP